MQKAIILGASGYIGKALVKELLQSNIEVVCLLKQNQDIQGNERQKNSHKWLLKTKKDSKLLQIIYFDNLKNDINIESSNKELAFYNLAWRGKNRLNDGGIKEQINNVILTGETIKLAKKLGCKKFINVSSQEQTIFESYLQNKWQNEPYTSNAIFYSGAKFAAFELGKLTAYLEKIDFINTKFSIPLDSNLSSNSFVASNFKKILKGIDYEVPKNTQECEIINLNELALALKIAGQKGKNNADYYLGNGVTQTLENYFLEFKNILENKDSKSFLKSNKDFSPKSFQNDTNFSFKKGFKELAKEIINNFLKEKK